MLKSSLGIFLLPMLEVLHYTCSFTEQPFFHLESSKGSFLKKSFPGKLRQIDIKQT